MRRPMLMALACLSCLSGSVHAVEFVVRVPETTPKDAHLFIAGSLTVVGSWKADGLELTRAEDGTFHAEIPVEVGQRLEYKFTLGSWDTVEKNADGSERANRALEIDASTTHVEASVDRWASAQTAIASSVIGTLELHSIQSKSLGKPRTIRVWLPANYQSNPQERYAVLYMQDGQNCFDRQTSAFGNEWQIDESLTKLIADGKVPSMIVVGIDNGGADRIAEYTFVADTKHGGGNGRRYEAFVLDEVLPSINQMYRTRVGRESTFIGGSSLGGLVSIEIATRHPDVFGGVIAMSPSLWWAGASIVHGLERDSSRLANIRLWIDMGTREGDENGAQEAIEHARRVDAALLAHNIEHQLTVAEGGEHNEPAWAARFPAAVQYLLNGK